MNRNPLVSVVIPTHNRRSSLHRTLTGLRSQTFPLCDMEVLVVCDGCTDGTMGMIRNLPRTLALKVIEQAHRNPAAARNSGAARASGRLLLFLDDDIEPSPSLVEAHAHAHKEKPGLVVIGYLPPVVSPGQGDFLGIGLRNWWEGKFLEMRRPGHRFTYRDLLSGNFSLGQELFAGVGGFDPSFGTREDYELGMRLIRAGADFHFAAEALAYHHEDADLNRSFKRKYEEGKADVLMSVRHPELLPLLPLASPPNSPMKRALASRVPAAGRGMTALLRQVLRFLEWARMRGPWGRLHGGLCAYWYWRGVAEGAGTNKTAAISRRCNTDSSREERWELEVDLGEGVEAAERALDRARPAGVRLRLGNQIVGTLPSQAGTERLRGAHLLPALRTGMAASFLMALAMEGLLDTAFLDAGGDKPWR